MCKLVIWIKCIVWLLVVLLYCLLMVLFIVGMVCDIKVKLLNLVIVLIVNLLLFSLVVSVCYCLLISCIMLKVRLVCLFGNLIVKFNGFVNIRLLGWKVWIVEIIFCFIFVFEVVVLV